MDKMVRGKKVKPPLDISFQQKCQFMTYGTDIGKVEN